MIVFKEAWHKADLEPHGQERYMYMLDLVRRVEALLSKRKGVAYIAALAFLDINPDTHRRVIPDMHEAFTKMAFFFPSMTDYLSPGLQEEVKNSLMVNQAERAKTLPDRRRHNSNKTMPTEFWNEWRAIKKKGNLDDDFPDDWDKAIRPTIAQRELLHLQQFRNNTNKLV